MATVAQQLAVMARYNKWAHTLLWAAVQELPPPAVSGSVGLPFRSIAATYNHLLAADVLWYCRITGAPAAAGLTAADLVRYWAASPSSGQWDALPGAPSLPDVVHRILSMADAWQAYIASATDAALAATLRYTNTSGASLHKPLAPTLSHIFNHATHHRGQISVGLSLAGREVPPMDLTYFLDAEVAAAEAAKVPAAAADGGGHTGAPAAAAAGAGAPVATDHPAVPLS